MKRYVDLNADVGEGFGKYKVCDESELIPLLTSANIACGFHAGDPIIMRKITQMCADHNVGIGAHPGFPDLVGFGRRFMKCSDEELENNLYYQIGALEAFAKMAGRRLQHCSTHGAWGNWLEKDLDASRRYIQSLKAYDKNIIIKAMSGGFREQAAKELGMRTAGELHADRMMQSNGKLVPRSTEGSVLHDKNAIVERVLKAVIEGKVVTIDGTVREVKIDSILTHGDTPGSIEIVRAIREALIENGVIVTKLEDFIPPLTDGE